MADVPAYQKRVTDERDDLDCRLARLLGFIDSDQFRALPIAERLRLRLQALLMAGYLKVLNSRINAFGA